MMEAVSPKSEKKKGFEKYELDNAVRTLVEAEEIRQNSKLMAAIAPMMKDKMAAMKKATKGISSIKELREKIQENKDGGYDEEA